ncbi:PAX-interacting protein 1 [Hordeum vulgare]|nr:PAX-interacting protein 1 [Hordeum vulgare]
MKDRSKTITPTAVLEEKFTGTVLDAAGVVCVHKCARDAQTTTRAAGAAVMVNSMDNMINVTFMLPEDDHVGTKRKLVVTGFKNEYDPDFVDDDFYEYTSGDDVDDGNVDSFVWKEIEKIKAKGKVAYYKRKKLCCPYCTTKPKPKDGLFEHLLSHARDASKSGENAKIRACGPTEGFDSRLVDLRDHLMFYFCGCELLAGYIFWLCSMRIVV